MRRGPAPGRTPHLLLLVLSASGGCYAAHGVDATDASIADAAPTDALPPFDLDASTAFPVEATAAVIDGVEVVVTHGEITQTIGCWSSIDLSIQLGSLDPTEALVPELSVWLELLQVDGHWTAVQHCSASKPGSLVYQPCTFAGELTSNGGSPGVLTGELVLSGDGWNVQVTLDGIVGDYIILPC